MKINFFLFSIVLIFSDYCFAGQACNDWLQFPNFREVYLERYVNSNDDTYIKDLFGCGVTVDDINSNSLLVVAIINKRLSVSQFLIDAGADVNKDIFAGERYNLLREAIRNIKDPKSAWLTIALKIVNSGIASDNLQEGLTISIGHLAELLPELTEQILLRGADPNYENASALDMLANRYRWTSYSFRLTHSREPTEIEMVEIRGNYQLVLDALLRSGANPNLEGQILTNFAEYWDDVNFRLLLNLGADPNLEMLSSKNTVFSLYAKYTLPWCNNENSSGSDTLQNRLKRIKLMLDFGAKPNQTNTSCEELNDLFKQYGY